MKTAILEFRTKLWALLRQHDFFAKNDRVTCEMKCFFRNDLDQVADVMTNGALPIVIESARVPNSRVSG